MIPDHVMRPGDRDSVKLTQTLRISTDICLHTHLHVQHSTNSLPEVPFNCRVAAIGCQSGAHISTFHTYYKPMPSPFIYIRTVPSVAKSNVYCDTNAFRIWVPATETLQRISQEGLCNEACHEWSGNGLSHL